MIVLISLMMVAGSLVAGTTLFRWVDDQGRVHYSDQPQPQAEEIEVAEPATFNNREANRARQQPTLRNPAAQTETSPARDSFAGYEHVAVTAPTAEQVLWNLGSILTVNLKVRPALKPEHKFRVTYDGREIKDWPASATSYQVRDVYRGTHTVAVSIVDGGGKVLASGDPVTFYVKQTSAQN